MKSTPNGPNAQELLDMQILSINLNRKDPHYAPLIDEISASDVYRRMSIDDDGIVKRRWVLQRMK